MNAVEISGLYKSYEDGKIKALNGINLTIAEGEFVSIIGPSGSGKSTLLNMLGALDVPDSGSITVAGQDLKSSKKLNEFRAESIGFIFQLHNLIPNISVVENIEIPMFTQKMSSNEMRSRALKLLDDVGLKDKADMKPNKLSGGERQRVAIARALANDPSIILADEPTGSLDSKTSSKILKQLIDLHEDKNVTLIIVTHDMDVAKLADRVVEVLDGEIISAGFALSILSLSSIYTIVKISMTTCKASRINAVWLNATTEAALWSMAPPAKTATMTTTIDEPIAAKICLRVLFTAVPSSTLSDTMVRVHVVAGIRTRPAPIRRIAWVMVMNSKDFFDSYSVCKQWAYDIKGNYQQSSRKHHGGGYNCGIVGNALNEYWNKRSTSVQT